MSQFWDVAPVFVIFPVMGLMLKWYFEYKIKVKLIEKGIVDERVKILETNSLEKYAPASLKWGIVLVFVGVALLVIQLLPRNVSGELILGVILVAGGVGMLLYYFVATILKKKGNELTSPKDTQ